MDLSAIDAALRQAVGQSRTVDDHVTPAAVERLAVTLDSGEPVPASGDPLPWGWHAVFCLKAPARAELEADGLPVRFDQIPPVPMQRRLFGGARLTFHTPLLIGQPVRCESELIDVKTRSTAGAHLAIATLRHRFSGPGGLAVEEEQDIIHMEPVGNAAEKPAANPAPMLAPTWQRHFTPDPVMLFRFSALTFNSHRIHYDAPYSADVEKLPGLMVQGRLISLQLLETVRVRAPKARLQRFEYRSGSPLFVGGACALNARLD
ncbi:unnamed protein product, partial [Phaeothamnion confervicola]